MESSSSFRILLCTNVLAMLLVSLPTHSEARTKEWHVHVVNGLSGPPQMLVHCQSKDDDLGNHYLSVGGDFNWEFSMNYWGSTLFFCRVSPDINRTAIFDVFRGNFLPFLYSKCRKSPAELFLPPKRYYPYDCFWVAKEDGVYFRDFSQNPPVDIFQHKWEKSQLT